MELIFLLILAWLWSEFSKPASSNRSSHNKPDTHIERYTYGQQSADEALERRADKVKAKSASLFRDDHSHDLGHVNTTLYYVLLQRRGRSYYKIGVTAKRRVLDRFQNEIEAGLKVKALKTWRYSNRGEALKKEKYILALFDNYRIKRGGPLNYGGNTEVFREDIFDLQSRVDDRYIKSKSDRAQRYLGSDAL